MAVESPMAHVASVTQLPATGGARSVPARDLAREIVGILAASPIGMAVASADAVLTDVNHSLCRLLDLDRDALVGRSLLTLAHPDDATLVIVRIQDLLAGRVPAVGLRARLVARDGESLWVDLSLAPISTDAGQPSYLVQVVDVSTEVATFEVLQHTAQQYRLLAENASDVVAHTDVAGIIRWVSPSLVRVLGWEPTSVVGTHLASLVQTDDVHRLPAYGDLLALGPSGARGVVVRCRTLTGAFREMALSVRPVSTEDGIADGAVISLRDVTEEQIARRTLARSEERFRLAMAAAPHGMAIADSTGCFVQVNAALCGLLAVERPAILGRRMGDFLDHTDLDILDQIDDALLSRREDSVSLEHRLVALERDVWVVHAVSILRDERGVPLFYVHQFVDQSEARRLRADLEYRASRDALTGVSNRAELMAHLSGQLHGVQGQGRIGVLFVDIDNLKPINDGFGHRYGDDVITAVAARLTQAVRREDLVARIGGDEFVVVLDRMHSPEELRRIADKCLAVVCAPVESGDEQIPVSVSIGAVLASTADTPDHVLMRADEALYLAKESGRSQVSVG